jgi:cytochrome d ubiquinol oxidase subunit II
MGVDLPLIWAGIIGFGLMMYVIMDGFDLGIGILFPFVTDSETRDAMVNTVAPVWDGNETWLVLGGAALFAAFPIAYGFLLSALYLPLILMLIGLILRGVSFEFRFKAASNRKRLWDNSFTLGSYVATFSQGVAVGAFIDGFEITGDSFAGSALDCFTPFSVFTGFALLSSYALLGSTWLIMKCNDELEQRMRILARWISTILFATIVAVSVWTPLAHPQITARWFSFPNVVLFAPVPILVALVTWLQGLVLRAREYPTAPFVLSLLLIFLGYSGLVISVWPNAIPPSFSIWDAAAPPQSQGFALVGTLFVIPVILAYTSWSYFVFRGKQDAGEGYR